MTFGRGSFYSALLLLAIGSATAHICMWSPMQRADFNIGEPGYQGCYLKVGPCGTNSTGPITTLKAGQTFAVQFQQNLNHYYVSNPGWMDVSWAPTPTPQESDFQAIGPRIVDYNAMNEITQTNFSININIPNTAVAHGVLRVRYVSNNPLENDRGEIFYQCADISIVAANSSSDPSVPAPAPAPAPVEPEAGIPCCAPKQWVSQFYRVGAGTLNPIHGTIYYDAINKFMRVDTHAGNGGTIYDGNFQMYMNFSNGMEYYYNSFDNSCGLYGLDYWNDWCYGTPGESETYSTTVTYGDVPADVWQNGEFFFVNEQKSCLPMFLSRSNGDMTVYYNVEAGIPDPSVFSPPQVCLHQQHSDLSVSRALKAGAEVPEHVRWLREVASRMLSQH